MKKLFKKGALLFALGVAMASGAAFIFPQAFASTNENINQLNIDNYKTYNNKDVIVGQYSMDDKYIFNTYYSDGFFLDDPNYYNPHMASLADCLANASSNYVDNSKQTVEEKYANGAKRLISALKDIGFNDQYVSDSYNKKPTADSIGCVIADKKLNNMKYKYVIDITIRSAGYELEWASNVKLGQSGEAEGFKNSADQVVNIYFNDFLKTRTDIVESLKNGKVAFFINGYSRGGATANLTAKRLIDEYQKNGNAIYAYCIEAPQGGVKEELKEGNNYNCIHNIINPNDLVVYVAPTLMGFMRYGVDHYVAGIKNEDVNYGMRPFLSDADTKFDIEKYEINKSKVGNIIKKALYKEDYEKYLPQDVTLKKFDLRKLNVNKLNTIRSEKYLQLFVDSLLTNKNKVVIDRNIYANRLQQSIVNVITFMKSIDENIKLQFKLNYIDIIETAIFTLAKYAKVLDKTDNVFKTIYNFITDNQDLTYIIDLTPNLRKELANKVKNLLSQQEQIMDVANIYYPTGSKGMLDDAYNLIYELTASGNNIDEYITMISNLDNILKNHELYQTMGWIRYEDDWYYNPGGIGGW